MVHNTTIIPKTEVIEALDWSDDKFIIQFVCRCAPTLHLIVCRHGQLYQRIFPPRPLEEYPIVFVQWTDEYCTISCTCPCGAGFNYVSPRDDAWRDDNPFLVSYLSYTCMNFNVHHWSIKEFPVSYLSYTFF
ncbi:unnamed protein product [Cochlearia groenlandica]